MALSTIGVAAVTDVFSELAPHGLDILDAAATSHAEGVVAIPLADG